METPLEKIAYIVLKAQEYQAEVPPEGLENGSNPTDDQSLSILEDTPDNPTHEELRAAFENLNVDQMTELVALMWWGRDDTMTNWTEALRMAEEMHPKYNVRYLMETPLLGDFIEEGLNKLGYSLSEYQQGRL